MIKKPSGEHILGRGKAACMVHTWKRNLVAAASCKPQQPDGVEVELVQDLA
jgi:hypothetical protein